jgi:hypothetical protein
MMINGGILEGNFGLVVRKGLEIGRDTHVTQSIEG